MRFQIQNKTRKNTGDLMRGLGYHFMNTHQQTSELVFIRSLGQDFYPRFHIYVREKGNELEFNLHLDQKKPRYKGVSAHSGEYEGKVVEQEAERIKAFLAK